MADRTAAETARYDRLLAEGNDRTIGMAAVYDDVDVLDAVPMLAADYLSVGLEAEDMAYALAGLALHVRRRGGDPRG